MSKLSDKAWVTLLTKSSYLAGVLVLAHSLKKQASRYPLVVLITPSLPQDARLAITVAGLKMREVNFLEPSAGWAHNERDHRFQDTWTKLTAFGVAEYERVVLLDSDMLITGNMDHLLEFDLPEGSIAACHACTCNPRKLKHYPADWVPENCPHSAAIGTKPVSITAFSPPTHQLLNSGLVVLRPSAELFQSLVARLNNDPIVQTFIFPDQDFLALVFKDRWIPLGYQYNALKTLKQCHPKMWSDADVLNVHYIIDKPWASKPSHEDPHYVVNTWWWQEYRELREQWAGRPEWKVVASGVAFV